ncbi:hypothetical protein KIH27_17595 [Mycobacterium sp. M1]|uniref:Uncharacterized protein n=1 Tax=Mycolicibacter acidiphilus TaxID=2835306 RepID=A0ABS5RPG4_9MYCO|nr:hypothetical protein [Mycolicibacter acidiphilus]MBS9535401.1 hypothetical protein [Mycolicibacter acidiphilus]
MTGKDEQPSALKVAAALVFCVVVGVFCLVSGIRLLADPATCDGKQMAAADTCYHYGKHSERLQPATTTILKMPPRPKFVPGVDDDLRSTYDDVWRDVPATVTATVPSGSGTSRDDQVPRNRFEGVLVTLGGSAMLWVAVAATAKRTRGRRHSS